MPKKPEDNNIFDLDQNNEWEEYLKDVKKLKSDNKVVPQKSQKAVELDKVQEPSSVEAYKEEQQNNAKEISLDSPGVLDQKTRDKIKNGKIPLEAITDLHGMTLDRAFDHLISFVSHAYDDGLRMLLVITGKSMRRDERLTIRGSFLNIINHFKIRDKVLYCCQAHKKDGGQGAFYLYLKRKR